MLATIVQVKLHLGVSVSTYDAVLTQILTQIDAHIKKMIGRTVDDTDYEDEIYDGDVEYIQLKDYPLSLIGFTFEYNAGDSETEDWTTVPRTDYELYYDTGVIAMNSIYTGRRVLRTSYTAGYADADIPADLQMLAVRLTAKIYNKRKSEGTSNESLENVSFGWNDLMSPEDKMVVDNHTLKFFV